MPGIFNRPIAITYLFPLSLSVANAFKLLNEEPGGSEKILLWLKSKCRNLPSRRTTPGTCINMFHDKSMLSSSLKSKLSKAWSPKISRPQLTIEISPSLSFLSVVRGVSKVPKLVLLISSLDIEVRFHWFKACEIFSWDTETHLSIETLESIMQLDWVAFSESWLVTRMALISIINRTIALIFLES